MELPTNISIDSESAMQRVERSERLSPNGYSLESGMKRSLCICGSPVTKQFDTSCHALPLPAPPLMPLMIRPTISASAEDIAAARASLGYESDNDEQRLDQMLKEASEVALAVSAVLEARSDRSQTLQDHEPIKRRRYQRRNSFVIHRKRPLDQDTISQHDTSSSVEYHSRSRSEGALGLSYKESQLVLQSLGAAPWKKQKVDLVGH